MAVVPRVYDDVEAPSTTRVQGSIVGPYRVGAPIGRGGMANVLEAVDMRSGQRVALKVLRSRCLTASEAVARFIREGRALTNLAHPNIVRVFEHGVDDEGTAWIAMERLQGVPLSALIHDEQRLPSARAFRFVLDVAKALATVHAHKMIHRDIKPENIFVVAPDTPQERAMLIDFGVAHVTEAEMGEYSCRYTQAGTLLGSVAFMPPEQFEGKELDARADIFALGVTFYEALTGKLPFGGETFDELQRARLVGTFVPPDKRVPAAVVDRALADVIGLMLARDREARPANGVALLQALYRCERSMNGGGSLVTAEAPVVVPSRAPQKALVAIVVLVGLTLALGAGWLLHSIGRI